MLTKRVIWIVTAVAVAALAYYAATFGVGHHLSPTTRYRVLLAVMFAQTVALVTGVVFVAALLAEFRPYQRAASQLALLKGMYRALEIANTRGGFTVEVRDAIYQEADKVFEKYSALIRAGEGGS